MRDEERFEPKGRTVHPSFARRDGKFLSAVFGEAARVDPALSPRSNRRRFDGTRIGRGGVVARALTGSDRYPGFRSRRVFVQTRIFRFKGRALAAAYQFVQYIQRDGVTREGEHGQLYSSTDDNPSGKAFVERCAGDRHHFRLTIQLEDGAEYEDLRPLIRRFMARMEEDLGTRLEWVAGDHRDTAFPHTHMMLRGVDDTGENLVIAPTYIYHGMRERLTGIVSLDLGPRERFELELQPRLEIAVERFTSLDERFLEEMDDNRVVRSMGSGMVDHAIRTGRLNKLGSLGLASPLGRGRWRLGEKLEPTLRAFQERSGARRTLKRALDAAGLKRAASEQRIYGPSSGPVLTGRVVARDIAGANDAPYLILDADDGRSYYVRTSSGEPHEPLPEGAIVRVEPDLGGGGNRGERPPHVRLLSSVPLEQLAGHAGATWLDDELISPMAAPRHRGFGREVRTALAQRQSWLIDQGLASLEGEQLRYRPNLIAILQARAIQQASLTIAQETGLDFRPTEPGSRVDGIFRRRLDLVSGRFAVVEAGHEFTLVPWRPELRHAIGHHVSALVRGDRDVIWSIGRGQQLGL